MAKFPPVNDQMDEIRRGALEIIPEDELVKKLEASLRDSRPLIVKQGFDPTRPDLHIGHAVSLRKLRAIQELGHEVVFVVGDYTARVGDPTGRSETRPRLTPEDIDANARTYTEQVGRILDLGRVRVEYNSRWLAPLDLAAVLELTATYTVARMLERDDFSKRFQEQRPISLSEFMYPLMQAYDSVALAADVELGGNDQKFNLLVARNVQERYGQVPQVCLIMPLLRGTDGELKMSKSYDNYVGISDPPDEQYGRTMSIPDALLEEWIRLASGWEEGEVERAVAAAAAEPYRIKRALALAIVSAYHGPEAGAAAAAHFERVFRERELPEAIPEVRLSRADPALRDAPEGIWVAGLLVAAGLAASNSEAVRFLEQGAITADGARLAGRNARLPAPAGGSTVLRRGRRHFVRVIFD